MPGVPVSDVDFDAINYFRTDALAETPYPSWAHLRSKVTT
jgi:hypothetical protein